MFSGGLGNTLLSFVGETHLTGIKCVAIFCLVHMQWLGSDQARSSFWMKFFLESTKMMKSGARSRKMKKKRRRRRRSRGSNPTLSPSSPFRFLPLRSIHFHLFSPFFRSTLAVYNGGALTWLEDGEEASAVGRGVCAFGPRCNLHSPARFCFENRNRNICLLRIRLCLKLVAENRMRANWEQNASAYCTIDFQSFFSESPSSNAHLFILCPEAPSTVERAIGLAGFVFWWGKLVLNSTELPGRGATTTALLLTLQAFLPKGLRGTQGSRFSIGKNSFLSDTDPRKAKKSLRIERNKRGII